MIWLFKIDDENTIWYDKPKVNEYHLFDTDDIMFDKPKPKAGEAEQAYTVYLKHIKTRDAND